MGSDAQNQSTKQARKTDPLPLSRTMAAEDLPPPNDTATAASSATSGNDDDELFGNNNNDGEETSPNGGGAISMDVGGDDGIRSTKQMLKSNPPPQPLPPGWYLKPSHFSPGNYYYFNQDTGVCQWEYPVVVGAGDQQQQSSPTAAAVSQETLNATAAAAAAAVKSILKRSSSGTPADGGAKEGAAGATAETASPSPRKRVKTGDKLERQRSRDGSSTKEKKEHHHRHHHDRHHHRDRESSTSSSPKEVRVLHILKKHRGSRRPASWRNPKITDTKEKAIADLRELISILNQSGGDHKELRATFEELAKTESDCSSAKRGGDLGFFGRKKMQPAFEKASFGLRVGQLSDIVDTSSGVHVILRLA